MTSSSPAAPVPAAPAAPASAPVSAAPVKSVKSENNLVWLDMEMTGLSPENDRIIEVAVVVTDSELHILAEGPVLVIHQDDADCFRS